MPVVTPKPKAPPAPVPASLAAKIAEREKVKYSFPRPPHLIVEARAGSGKTTTLIEGLKVLKGLPSRIDPSPQQAAVWDQILLSRSRCKFVCFVAFNSSIASELKNRVPAGVDAKTIHSMGFQAVRKLYPRVELDEDRVEKVICEVLEKSKEYLKKTRPILLRVGKELTDLARANLSHLEAEKIGWDAALGNLVDHYGIEFEDRFATTASLYDDETDAYDLVPKVLERLKQVDDLKPVIDYTDMIWLPVVLGLPLFRFDVLFVDEAQDLNRCQQELVIRAGERLILCGDPFQAIYGFAGADSDSMPRMFDRLKKDRDCLKLPLTETRRCGRKIVAEANIYVKEFSAHSSNGEGKVSSALYPIQNQKRIPDEKTYLPLVKDGDMILSRANAPLVSQCLKFFRLGRRAHIRGRKFGDALVSLIRKIDATTIPEFIKGVTEWADHEIKKEEAKASPSASKMDGIADRADCLICIADDCKEVPQLIQKIDSLFSDSDLPGIGLSSIHRAKGLENARVFILAPGGFRGRRQDQKDWEWQAELNLRYVGITRAIEELTYVF